MQKYKLIFTVPLSHADAVRQAIGKAGAGTYPNYSFCSFSTRGIGRFKPETGANPAIGEVGKFEESKKNESNVRLMQIKLTRY